MNQMSGEPGSVEDRRGKRYRYSADATLRQLDTGLTLPGVILDLSARGGLFRLSEPSGISVGTFVDLTVHSRSVTFRALGSIRHCSPELRLIGISFVNLNRLGQSELRELIKELESKQQPKRSQTRLARSRRGFPPTTKN
jgi:PilZ domain